MGKKFNLPKKKILSSILGALFASVLTYFGMTTPAPCQDLTDPACVHVQMTQLS